MLLPLCKDKTLGCSLIIDSPNNLVVSWPSYTNYRTTFSERFYWAQQNKSEAISPSINSFGFY